MNPLCVFCEPPLFTKLGQQNLNNFEKAGSDVLRIIKINITGRWKKYFLLSWDYHKIIG